MTATRTEARDEILGTFRTAWLASSASQDLPVIYPDSAADKPASGAYARVAVSHIDGRTATLAGATGYRRFRREGFVTVSIYTPIGGGLTLNDDLSTIVVNAFEGVMTTSGVIFRNVRAQEAGRDGSRFQTNVLADFEYDEVK